MPFKSKAQARYMFWAEKQGKVPKGTAKEWAHKTKSIKALPERVKEKGVEKTAEILLNSTLSELQKIATVPPKKLKSIFNARKKGYKRFQTDSVTDMPGPADNSIHPT